MTDVCFILGIMPRSGTNYLENQLILHDKCIAPGPVWEDFLVGSTPILEKLKKRLTSRWDNYWFRNTEINYLDKLGKEIGKGLTTFLLDQSKDPDARYLVTKTPTVSGLENFRLYFPESKLIIIVRDGRDVAESGTKSFQWDLIKALIDWKINARKIIQFVDQHPDAAFLVRFEDMFATPEHLMSEVITYLDLDETNYPFEKLKNMPVSGSSTLKVDNEKINWKATEKKKNFQPVSRYKSWSPWKKFLSIVIAGSELDQLGYDISEKIPLEQKILAYSFLITWPFLTIPRTLYYLLKEKTFVLKTH